jgi:hypothetical protein
MGREPQKILTRGKMRRVLLVVMALMPITAFAASVDSRCPKGYVWSDSQKRCITVPPEAKEGACTKSAKPWMLNCSTSKNLLSIDAIYQNGYYIDRYSNGFFFVKKRGSSNGQEHIEKSKVAPRATADSPDSEK